MATYEPKKPNADLREILYLLIIVLLLILMANVMSSCATRRVVETQTLYRTTHDTLIETRFDTSVIYRNIYHFDDVRESHDTSTILDTDGNIKTRVITNNRVQYVHDSDSLSYYKSLANSKKEAVRDSTQQTREVIKYVSHWYDRYVYYIFILFVLVLIFCLSYCFYKIKKKWLG